MIFYFNRTLMERTLALQTIKNIGKEVRLCGWVDTIRSHGKLIFIDLRDRSGLIQVVVNSDIKCSGENREDFQVQYIRKEWVIEIIGVVRERPEKMVNPKIETGKVEVEARDIVVLSEAKPLPFEPDNPEVGEELRMKYRYLDLRSRRMQENLRLRYQVIRFIRDFLDKKGFIEVETPLLTKSTPEGARDFLVPSRLHPGQFYALPQSPQQFKQILMVSGIERYFQIARCLRDEDPRGDRQPEHTQLDLEMSFVDQEEIMRLNEELLIKVVKEFFPEKRIKEVPFPRLSFKEAMEKYGTDRPDLRSNKNDPDELTFCWVVDFPFFERDKEGKWTFTHNPFSMPKKEYIDDLLALRNIEKILTTQYDIVLNGYEIGGGSIRAHKPEILRAVFKVLGYKDQQIERDFGHMLKALSFGAPPHGGIAWGLARLLMILRNEPSIREVIAFPKTGDGRDLMMVAPSPVTEQQLKELHIKISKE